MPKIFISYRREDSKWPAGQIRDRLTRHFGREAVVFDVDSIPIGVDYRKYLQNQVARCDVLCAVIGRQWLSLLNERLDSPKDFVRIEIQAALQREIPLIPVLVDGASIPEERDLPSNLADLAYRNGVEVDAGRHLQDHLRRLVAGLEEILKPDAASEGRRQEQNTLPETEGSFVDPDTNLMWTVKDNGKDVDWMQASAYARKLRLGGYSDWRLPTIGELKGLYDRKNGGEHNVKRPIELTTNWAWSSTKEGSGAMSLFYFGGGYQRSDPVDFSGTRRALCVRDP